MLGYSGREVKYRDILCKILLVISILSIIVFISGVFVLVLMPTGLHIRIFGVRISARGPSNLYLTMFVLTFLLFGLFSRKKPSPAVVLTFTAIFALIISLFKIHQFDYYMSNGFDLGIRANIINNIFNHRGVWDSLNGHSGFFGHFWPSAYAFTLLYRIWHSPKVLLVAQSIWNAMIFIPVYLLLKNRKINTASSWMILLLVSTNYYFHRMLAFDFHPETFAVPILLFFFYFLEREQTLLATIILFTILTLKEDMAIGVISIGLYFYLFTHRKKPGLIYIISGLIYFALSILVIRHAGGLGHELRANFNTGHFVFGKLLSPILYFLSFGFLPVVELRELTMIALPFLEHISTNISTHYMLRGQYVAFIFPVSVYLCIMALKKIGKAGMWVLIVGILAGLFYKPIVNLYDYGPSMSISKREYLNGLVSSIDDSVTCSCGNHISPHLCFYASVRQLPVLMPNSIVIIDTSWHDYTPMSKEQGQRFIKSLMQQYKIVSDSFGVLLLKQGSRPQGGCLEK